MKTTDVIAEIARMEENRWVDAITRLRVRSLTVTNKDEYNAILRDYARERLQELKDEELNTTDPMLRDGDTTSTSERETPQDTDSAGHGA